MATTVRGFAFRVVVAASLVAPVLALTGTPAGAAVNNPGPIELVMEQGSLTIAGLSIPLADATGPVVFSGSVAANGNLTFPPLADDIGTPIPLEIPDVGTVDVIVGPLGIGQGNINPNNGAATLGFGLQVRLAGSLSGFDLGSNCRIGGLSGIGLNLTTGTVTPPPPGVPSSGIPYSRSSGRMKLVGGQTMIPQVKGCGGFLSFIVDPLINGALGLPIPIEGASDASFVFSTNPVLNPSGVKTPPTANAGPDQTVAPGSTVTLDGSASSDVDFDILSHDWVQTGGPAVPLSNSSSEQPTLAAPAGPATLTYQLTVTDGTGTAPSIDTVKVNVPAPVLLHSVGAGFPEGDTGSKIVQVPVRLSGPSILPVTADWTTIDGLTRTGEATSGLDFVPASGTITFAPGETTKTVPVEIIGDTVKEIPAAFGCEWGFVLFSNLSSTATFDPNGFFHSSIFGIADDD